MKNIVFISLTAIVVWVATSCSELTFGDEFLGDQPESSGATLDTMFSSAVNADRVLSQAYRNLSFGSKSGRSSDIITDLAINCQGNPYYTGAINTTSSSSELLYSVGGESDWKAIRYAWLYMENLNRVPNMTEIEKAERIAEAKMIIAISYSGILRHIGGAPIIQKSISVTDNMNFPRATFAETVEYIVNILDEASPYLKWKQLDDDDGRMTKAGALGLKLRVLLFAASPTFNSSTPWHNEADEYTRYVEGDTKERWNRARKAGEEFMQELEAKGQYKLIQPIDETHEAKRLAFRKAYYERGGTEILISTRKGFSTGVYPNGSRYYWGPTLNYVNMFPWADGSDFPSNFDWANPSQAPFFDENHVPTRDPRLYETAALPGGNYYNGTLAPLYFGHPDYRKGASTGFSTMKFILPSGEDRAGKGTQFPYLRLPEVLLSYAEAINESEGGPNKKAYDCINLIRARVGLADLPNGLTKIQFREAVLKERALEFGFEDVRWYDLIRWGRADDFKKKLNILLSYVTAIDDGIPISFRYEVVGWLPERHWNANWDTKWYLSPIPQREISKNYGWTQNPGW